MNDGQTTLRQRLRAAALEAMLDAAERTMCQSGYERATMNQIAGEAGCAAGTFYLYFKSKEELFGAIVDRHAKVIFANARGEAGKTDDPVEKVRLGVEAMIRYAEEHRPFFRLLFTALPVRVRAMNEQLRGAAKEEHESYNQLELGFLRQAQEAGRVRRDVPAEVLQKFMDAVGYSFVEEFVFAETAPAVEEQMRVIWGLISGGIGVGSSHGHA